MISTSRMDKNHIQIHRWYNLGGFVYDFYPWVRMCYLKRVSAANEWQISHPNEFIYTNSLIYPYTIEAKIANFFVKLGIFGSNISCTAMSNKWTILFNTLFITEPPKNDKNTYFSQEHLLVKLKKIFTDASINCIR